MANSRAKREMMKSMSAKKSSSDDNWMQSAVKRPGALHEKLDVPMDKKIPLEKIEDATHSKSKLLRQQANFALNARKMNKK